MHGGFTGCGIVSHCLGTGEAGKSTFIKQMRIIHGAGYTTKDRAEYRVGIYKHILHGMQILINAMKLLDICCTNLANEVCQCLLPWTIGRGGEGRGGEGVH